MHDSRKDHVDTGRYYDGADQDHYTLDRIKHGRSGVEVGEDATDITCLFVYETTSANSQDEEQY